MILSALAYTLFFLVVIGTILVILTDEDGDSGKKIAWIIVVALLPVIGILCYIVFGLNPRRNSKYEEHARRFHDAFSEYADSRTYRRLFGEKNREKIRG